MSSSDNNTSSNWTPPSVAELQAMLPQYEVTALWGRGGMGAVYKGRQKSLHRDVAIKVLPENFAAGDKDSDPHQFVERFKLEARSMANLDHPAILSVHDFGQTEQGQLYLVMEFVDGMDIFAYLQHHGGKLPDKHAIAICSHVLDALQYAHDSGVIHRDIKPSNVLINSQGRVKLADFGLAKRIAEEEKEEDSGAPMTMPNMAMGTPDYVAPETLDSSQEADGRADLYAVGVMLYELLTGKLPRGQFKMPSEMMPGLDVRFDAVVSKALQTDPNDRYASATAFRGDLDRILSQPIPQAEDPQSSAIPLEQLAEAAVPAAKTKPSEPEKSKAPLWIGVALAAALLVGVGIYLMTRPDDAGNGTAVAQAGSPSGDGPAAPAFPSTPEPVPSKPPTPEPAPTPATPTPEPTEPLAAAKPEPTPEPDPAMPPAPAPAQIPSTTPPAPPAPATPAKPEDPQPPEPAPENAQLASIPGLKNRLEAYLTARRTAVEELATSYLKGLDLRMNQAADGGDLKLTKAYRGEKTTVEELQKALKETVEDPVVAVGQGATLPPLADDAPDGLVNLRKVWVNERQKIRADLDGKLQQSLKALESDLTKKRELEQAEMILAYRETLGGKSPAAVASTPGPAKPTPPAPDPASVTNTAMASHRATKDKPFENSLGMRFMPVPITGGPSDGKLILFSVWETRVKDYEEFIKKDRNREWTEPDFEQDDDHPAVLMSWDDASAFSDWLTEKERGAGKMGKDEAYRLPTDHEWSCAIGIGGEESAEATPETKHNRLKRYPWGGQWPPVKVSENYCGVERAKYPIEGGQEPIANYDDGYAHTAPVGSFEGNDFGLHDLGGNVRELCDDWYNPNTKDKRSSRGASWWLSQQGFLLSSYRGPQEPDKKNSHLGFRVVLDTGVPAPEVPTVTETPPPSATPQIDRGALKLASKERPFVNSLGMKFVPVPGTDILMCIHETRRVDYSLFAEVTPGLNVGWQNAKRGGFPVGHQADHPAVNISWDAANEFCVWLSRMEGIVHRLPTDQEWSFGVGIARKESEKATPEALSGKIGDEFPWGRKWPPPAGAGNFADQSAKEIFPSAFKDYTDGFITTAPVMSFEPNDLGIFDLGGNVSEWCDDWFNQDKELRAARGANYCWSGKLQSSWRDPHPPNYLTDAFGFRVVIDPNAEVPATPQAAAKPIWSPAVIKAALEKKPGRLYGFGNAKGKPVSVATASKTNDFVQVTTRNNYGWIALRANGETLTDADEEPLDFDRKIEKLGGGQQGSLPGIFGIDGRGTVHITQVSAGFRPEPEVARQLRNVIDIESNPDGANAYHGLALKSDGSVVHWGPIYTRAGAKPPPQEALTAVKAIATYYAQCWAVKSDGSVISWMAGGDRVDIPPEIKGIREMAADGQFCIALTEEAKVLAWGRNYKGCTDVPEDLGKCIAIRIGGYAAAAQKEDGSWVAWGDGDDHVKKINSLGPVTDLDFVGSSGQKTDFVFWIKADVE